MALATESLPRAGSLHDLIAVEGRTAVVSGISKDPNGKVTAMLIDRGSDQPALVAKVATTRQSAWALAAEAAVLEGLDRGRLGEIGASIPKVVGWTQDGGSSVLVLSGLRGSSMLAGYHAWRHTASPERVRADFAAVSDWLDRFQWATSGQTAPLADRTICGSIASRFDGDPLSAPALASLDKIQARLDSCASVATAVHGDLWLGNILLQRGVITGVVDWEAGRLQGPPTGDWVRFALTYALYLDRHTRAGAQVPGHEGLKAGTWGSGIRHVLAGRSWFSELVKDFVGSALARLGADSQLWKDALREGLAAIAATADDPAFARRHLEIFVELS